MADPPSFTLIGDTTGGPPETRTWTRNGVTISDGGSYSISLTVPGVDRFDVFPLDTQIFQQSRYRSTLTVTGNLPEGVVSKNDVPAWERVLHFGTRCLRGFQLGVVAGCPSLPREISSCVRRRRTLLLSIPHWDCVVRVNCHAHSVHVPELADVLPEVAAAMQQPHDRGTPTFDSTDTPPPESATPPVYSNINISDRPELVSMLGPKPKQPSYAVVDIVRLPSSTVKNRSTKPRILKQTSLNMIPAMEPKSSPKSSSSVSNRQRSLSTFNDVSESGSSHQDVFAEESDSRNKGVVYASLNMIAMSAVEHIRKEHKDVRNFEDLLQRHDLREEEMNRRRGKVSTSHDQ